MNWSVVRKNMIELQAKDSKLWFGTQVEHVQNALRALHAAVEEDEVDLLLFGQEWIEHDV